MQGDEYGELIGYRVGHRKFLLDDDPAALDAAKAHAEELAQQTGRTVNVWPVYGSLVELGDRPLLVEHTPTGDQEPVAVFNAHQAAETV